ncbi:hypothetical protein ACFOGI_14545 [Virgibacillus xinjiangensis]|uniref:Uncharacterized protein n=1 Tax=Virgibacillus xinjiangensis TaxID=393090 RepID=A0ABV7CY85_9BACI
MLVKTNWAAFLEQMKIMGYVCERMYLNKRVQYFKKQGVVVLSLYLHNYLDVFKRNFMLVVMALVLLAITFFVWAGVPFFIIGSFVADFTSNFVIIYFCISLSGGFLFSLYFVPFNLKIAKNIASIKNFSVAVAFVYLQTGWILVSSSIFGTVLILMNVLC